LQRSIEPKQGGTVQPLVDGAQFDDNVARPAQKHEVGMGWIITSVPAIVISADQ